MADYIFMRKSRNAMSSFLHILLNVFLGVISIFITVISGSWLLGIGLVIVSKWRIFAVRPRYWLTNLKSSLVDFIVGSSLVLIAYSSGTNLLPLDFVLSAIYIIWLVFIKPKEKSPYPLIQSLFAVFLGSTAAILLTSSVDPIIFIILEFIVGASASRHIYAQSATRDNSILVLSNGLLCAEIAWLCHTWMIYYAFGSTGIIIPQFSIIITLVAFVLAKISYNMSRHDGKIILKEILPSIIFSLLTIIIIIIFFSKPIFNI